MFSITILLHNFNYKKTALMRTVFLYSNIRKVEKISKLIVCGGS